MTETLSNLDVFQQLSAACEQVNMATKTSTAESTLDTNNPNFLGYVPQHLKPVLVVMDAIRSELQMRPVDEHIMLISQYKALQYLFQTALLHQIPTLDKVDNIEITESGKIMCRQTSPVDDLFDDVFMAGQPIIFQ